MVIYDEKTIKSHEDSVKFIKEHLCVDIGESSFYFVNTNKLIVNNENIDVLDEFTEVYCLRNKINEYLIYYNVYKLSKYMKNDLIKKYIRYFPHKQNMHLLNNLTKIPPPPGLGLENVYLLNEKKCDNNDEFNNLTVIPPLPPPGLLAKGYSTRNKLNEKKYDNNDEFNKYSSVELWFNRRSIC
tara:strand:- start:331 stop:882 length:552 start_codon:yes stop_codon:yes gene_type:complete